MSVSQLVARSLILPLLPGAFCDSGFLSKLSKFWDRDSDVDSFAAVGFKHS